MESPGNPRIKPPDANHKKKAGGSFAKRNIWLIGVLAGVLLIGGISWFIYKVAVKVAHYQKVSLTKPDSVDDDNYTNLKVDTAIKADTGYTIDSKFIEPYDRNIKSAKLNITADAMSFGLADTSNSLFEAKSREHHHRLRFDSHKEGSGIVMNFNKEKSNDRKLFSGETDSVSFKLNRNPEWEFSISAGATDLNFDLSKFKVRSVKLNGGAGAYVLKFGQPLSVTNIAVSTGASEVTIKIPKDAACHIKLDSGLSSSTFDGFNKKGENEYETSGFGSAKNKIFIEFTGGISDYKVNRY